jgi:hypothetical protein
VSQFVGGWLLEACDLTALRVHTAHHVLDHAVFAGGIHALKHYQERITVASPKQLLRIGEALEISPDDFLGFLL